MQGIVYLELDGGSIDLIRPLWEQLNQHHLERTPHFRQHYEEMTFAARREELLKKERLRVILALEGGRAIGYCVASLEKGQGEIDSIFVEGAHRRSGVGQELLKKAIAWLDASGATKKIVAVAAGNEAAIPFYGQFGFLPRLTVLEFVDGPR